MWPSQSPSPRPNPPTKKKFHPCVLQFKLTQNAFSLAPTVDSEKYYYNKLYLPPFFLVKIKYNSR